MKAFTAFFKLIRWPNLLFIVYLEGHPGYEEIKLSQSLFFLLVFASVCIAAAGYIINDYFDVNIDQVNKSSKVIVGVFINRRAAILLHAVLSLVGFVLSAYVLQASQLLYSIFQFVGNRGVVVLFHHF